MRVAGASLCLILLGALGAGCDDEASSMTGPDGGGGATPDGGGPLPGCATTGSGMLTVTVNGLPAGAAAAVRVRSESGMEMNVTATQTLTLPAGTYSVSAARVATPDPLARAAYEPTVAGAPVCVRDAQPSGVTVTYAQIATSNKLWVTSVNSPARVLGFSAATAGASGMPPATVAAMTRSTAGFTFDAAGNLWALGATTTDPPVARYAAASLASSGAKMPDISIDSPSFGRGTPGPRFLAFDGKGNLWSTAVAARKVVMFTPAQIAASGNPTATVELDGIVGPGALAFDRDGNLWVTAEMRVLKFAAARLGASTMGPDLTLQLQTPPPVVINLRPGDGLAFDRAGNLWVSCGSTLVRLTPDDQSGSGMKTLTPAVQIGFDVTALPHGLAFDESGGLWVAGSRNAMNRFSAAQLATSGKPMPEITITSGDVGAAQHFAIYPAPAGLPLYHRLP